MWRAVTDLWRQDKQTAHHRSGHTKTQRLAHRDLLREEAELMAHEVEGLHPLEGRTYLRAEELMRRIMEWWRVEAAGQKQMEAAGETGRCGVQTATAADLGEAVW